MREILTASLLEDKRWVEGILSVMNSLESINPDSLFVMASRKGIVMATTSKDGNCQAVLNLAPRFFSYYSCKQRLDFQLSTLSLVTALKKASWGEFIFVSDGSRFITTIAKANSTPMVIREGVNCPAPSFQASNSKNYVDCLLHPFKSFVDACSLFKENTLFLEENDNRLIMRTGLDVNGRGFFVMPCEPNLTFQRDYGRGGASIKYIRKALLADRVSPRVKINLIYGSPVHINIKSPVGIDYSVFVNIVKDYEELENKNNP